MSGDVATVPDADERSMGRWNRRLAAAVPETPDRLPGVEALYRRACLAHAPDRPRSCIAVARLATGRRGT
ncbi:hypothetical protein GWK16_24435 [Roseomonas sp. JC162]|uniref:Uncharacterized protein n=1 Tax=Neoroseomonas marina TaxID=1232220 RepID=A0A848EKE1_9PROT|nr:hypothetical protein [Neoroseomonas marina]NMJ44416.1 hypothetical protein [Neoroseomonas marina]